MTLSKDCSAEFSAISAPEVAILRLRHHTALPAYAHSNDAGMDICAAEDVCILPGETKLVPTGFALAIPDGYEAQIRPRSGISLKTMLRIPNSPGTIDAGYRDEVCILIHNASLVADISAPASSTALLVSEKDNRQGTYQIRTGDKIAQMVFAPITKAKLTEVSTLEGIGSNRAGGFGSTGVR